MCNLGASAGPSPSLALPLAQVSRVCRLDSFPQTSGPSLVVPWVTSRMPHKTLFLCVVICLKPKPRVGWTQVQLLCLEECVLYLASGCLTDTACVFFFKNLFLIFMCDICLDVCALCVHYPQWPGEGTIPLGTGVAGSCEWQGTWVLCNGSSKCP